MKYLYSYNESLRDKMVGKSKDEILTSLKGNPTVTYKRIRNDIGASWLIGEIETTYDILKNLFGKPKKNDWIGNNFLWNLKSNNNHYITIYDNGTDLEPEELKNINYKWHIGGRDKQDANDLISYIYKNII